MGVLPEGSGWGGLQPFRILLCKDFGCGKRGLWTRQARVLGVAGRTGMPARHRGGRRGACMIYRGAPRPGPVRRRRLRHS
ncbi:hypothetical protein GCM10023081_41210 [Arthrobacter ginkgonis]|uniref:Uncharacterized protein n=1 Tax=Arthrobacter ginkgonis TaxID=1630594 RepID=A0ABP7D6V4_9MICC